MSGGHVSQLPSSSSSFLSCFLLSFFSASVAAVVAALRLRRVLGESDSAGSSWLLLALLLVLFFVFFLSFFSVFLSLRFLSFLSLFLSFLFFLSFFVFFLASSVLEEPAPPLSEEIGSAPPPTDFRTGTFGV